MPEADKRVWSCRQIDSLYRLRHGTAKGMFLSLVQTGKAPGRVTRRGVFVSVDFVQRHFSHAR